MGDDTRDFDQFLLTRTHAAEAYVNGDAGPLSGIAARSSDATFFGPGGGAVHGASAVLSRYQSDAPMFERGSTTRLEILHAAASGDVAYWVGYQHTMATARQERAGADEAPRDRGLPPRERRLEARAPARGRVGATEVANRSGPSSG